jgi:hypothetical protein
MRAFGPETPTAGILAWAPVIIARPPPRLIWYDGAKYTEKMSILNLIYIIYNIYIYIYTFDYYHAKDLPVTGNLNICVVPTVLQILCKLRCKNIERDFF